MVELGISTPEVAEIAELSQIFDILARKTRNDISFVLGTDFGFSGPKFLNDRDLAILERFEASHCDLAPLLSDRHFARILNVWRHDMLHVLARSLDQSLFGITPASYAPVYREVIKKSLTSQTVAHEQRFFLAGALSNTSAHDFAAIAHDLAPKTQVIVSDIEPGLELVNHKESVLTIQMDLTQPWPIESGTLDVIATNNLLSSLQSETLGTVELVRQFLEQCSRALNPQGRIILVEKPFLVQGDAEFRPEWQSQLTELLAEVGLTLDSDIFEPPTIFSRRDMDLAIQGKPLQHPEKTLEVGLFAFEAVKS